MNGLGFVVAIVAIVMCAKVAETWIKQRKSVNKADEELDTMLEQIGRLEERIRVLERIVTESRVDLKRQIEDL